MALLALVAMLFSGDPDVETIHRLLESQASSWNEGNIKGYMDGYWESDSLVFTSGGNINRGWEATYQKYLHSYGTPDKMGILSFSENRGVQSLCRDSLGPGKMGPEARHGQSRRQWKRIPKESSFLKS